MSGETPPAADVSVPSERTPQRIQRSRTRDWRMPEGAVYVGRGSHLGNPFRIYEHCTGPDGDWGVEDSGRFNRPVGHGWATKAGAAEFAVAAYRREFDEVYRPGSTARFILAMDLAGRDLVCWCPPGQPCHADFLLEFANGEAAAAQEA